MPPRVTPLLLAIEILVPVVVVGALLSCFVVVVRRRRAPPPLPVYATSTAVYDHNGAETVGSRTIIVGSPLPPVYAKQ